MQPQRTSYSCLRLLPLCASVCGASVDRDLHPANAVLRSRPFQTSQMPRAGVKTAYRC